MSWPSSFSTPDLVGHAFGPRSQEIKDVYADLDRTIGRLLDALDDAVGRDNYVVGLSADHGVTDIPEQIVAAGGTGGRIGSAAVTRTVEEAAAKALGPGRYVARVNSNDIYFAPGRYAQLTAAPDALAAVVKALSTIASVAAKVFTSAELLQCRQHVVEQPAAAGRRTRVCPGSQRRHRDRAEVRLDFFRHRHDPWHREP